MNSISSFALNLIRNNPNIANNPNAKELIDVISSGDAKRGQEIANNILKSYGADKDEALAKARSFFGI